MNRTPIAPHDRRATTAKPSASGVLPTLDRAQADKPGDDAQPWPARVSRELRLWLLSFILFAPALVPYASHYAFQPQGRLPTGFIQYDLPYYLANAREYFDDGRFRFSYSNPFDTSYDSAAIYFQPWTLVLGMLMQFTSLAPHEVFLLFALAAGWVCSRVAVAFYASVVGLAGWERRLGLLAFFWGGGLLTVAGAAYVLATGRSAEDVLVFDPAHGWWFLNFGRNLVYPPEALYHALSFGCILCVLRRRYWLAGTLAVLLSTCHPYTGLEILLILVSWLALELFFVRSREVPIAFFVAISALLVLHIGYYLVYLPRFPEHRALMKQLSLPFLLQAENFVPAYALVGAMAFWSFRKLTLARAFFAEPKNRLFLVWFLVAFALANHELAFEPMQPLHFTRGYIWTPLFLMSTTTLLGLFTNLRLRGGRVAGSLAIGLVLAVLLLDNAAWLGRFPWRAAQGRPLLDFPVTADQLALYDWMNRPENRGAFVITDQGQLGYLAAVYTPLRSWLGSRHHTPDIAAREREVAAFLENGQVIDPWRGESLLVILDRQVATPSWLSETGAPPVYENPGYRVYRVSPPGKVQHRPPRTRADADSER